MFENTMLGRIFGSKGEVTEDWGEMRNEERHNLHLSSNTEIVKSGHAAYIVHGREEKWRLFRKPVDV
jgi:hypothetical protein